MSIATHSGNDQAARLREMVESLDRKRASPVARQPDRPTSLLSRWRSCEPRTAEGALPSAAQSAAAVKMPKVLAIASGKGGVGKTNTSVNLAVAFAQLGLRTTLLDGDLGLANADLLCGLNVQGHVGHVIEGLLPLRDIVIDAPGGFRLAPGGAGVAHLAGMDSSHVDTFVRRLAGLEEDTDLLIVDCGAGVGPGVLAFLAAADVALVVTTPEPTSITDAYSLLKCAAVDAARRGAPMATQSLWVNQARDASEARHVHERVGAAAGRFLGVDISLAGWAPRDAAVPRAVRLQQPFVLSSPRSGSAIAVRRLARRLRGTLELLPEDDRPAGLLKRLLRGMRSV